MSKGLLIPEYRAIELLKRLLKRKKALKLSWEACAVRAGISRRSLFDLRNHRLIGPVCVRRICHSFGWSAAHFLSTGEGKISVLSPDQLQREADFFKGSEVGRRELVIAGAGLIRARLADIEGLTVEDVLTAAGTVQITARRHSSRSNPRLVEVSLVSRQLVYGMLACGAGPAGYQFEGAGILSSKGVEFCAEYLTIPVVTTSQEHESARAEKHHVNSHQHIEQYHHGSSRKTRRKG